MRSLLSRLAFTVVLLALTVVLPRIAGAQAYQFLYQLGGNSGQFSAPAGVATDAAGNVYVADESNSRIQKFTSTGAYVTQWGSPGIGNGQFSYPSGVATDTAGNVYVADTGNSRVQVFTSTGGYVTQWGSFGNGNGQFNSARGVATDAAGNVYVADESNSRIQKFTGMGAYVTQWVSPGIGYGQFSYPHGVATDASGNVYVADKGNTRVQKFGYPGADVSTTAALAFALSLLSPNPWRGGTLAVTFTLPSAGTASLGLFDVAGRLIDAHDVGSLGAGRHTINICPCPHLAPGLYLVRLARGASARVARVVALQ